MAAHPHLVALLKTTARIRDQLGPAPDDERAVPEACERCGTTFIRWKGRRRHHCAKCTAAIALETAEEIQAKAGPAYEKNVLAQLRHWLGEADRLDLLDGDGYVRFDADPPPG